MSRPFRKCSHAKNEHTDGKHRFEHGYRDNTVYFITARTRDGYAVFETDKAKEIFRDRFDHWTRFYGFEPWVTTLLNNHYHTEGYLKVGTNLGPLMQRLHGSVAKLVNDLLSERRVPFWRERGTRDYFDGCIRNERQCRRAYRYTLLQAVRAGIVRDWRDYRHTRVGLEFAQAMRRALELKAFEGLELVPYPRYDRKRSGR